ncbi:transglycosylase domain-containing protein [Luteibaculum oceani]|uniref:Penicillin-binding protein n=1 Tax=Luteibaculum oceani TaxID=1294296 RepID=A0A5C6UZY4_9FLAO|nr:transglycosylase domain-containing protein [Luteibaculum oceani]TXC79003.1 penicillin-binding protein [Luteibaculum oceani]
MPNYARLFIKLILSLGVFAVLMLWLLWNGYLIDIPSDRELQNYELAQATEIYTGDSVLLGKMYLENRRCISFNEIPKPLIKCLISTEDSRYYDHNGVDFISLGRVLIKTIILGEASGGGSTITQQLVKQWFPRSGYETNNLVFHKLREMITALKLERFYSKEEILQNYFNTVAFGHNNYGVYTAADYYFNKKPAELSLVEMATLVALLRGTSFYDPQRFPDRCMDRRNLVLENMNRLGYLSYSQLAKAQKAPLVLSQKKNDDLAPYFLQHIKQRVEEICSSKEYFGYNRPNPYTDGLRVYTTINSKVQEYAEAALTSHLDELQKKFDREWTDVQWRRNKATLIRLIRLNKYPGYQKVCKALETGNVTAESDSLLRDIKKDLLRLRAGFTCIKNTGEVLAWVGGRDFSKSKFDHVKSARQVGSVFKPIVYVTAVDQGVNICNYFKNRRKSFDQFDDWRPRNASNSYHGEYTMKGALTHSINVISVEVLLRAGLSDVLNVAEQMGISRELPQVPSISIGTPDISLFQMVNAYTCFPNGGKRLSTRYINSIRGINDVVLYEEKTKVEREIFTENVAAIMTNMMESVVNVGTSRALRNSYKLKGPIAGKTGTSQNQSDGWFIGYTPKFSAGAWVGADYPDIHFRSLSSGAGSKTALPIWAKFVTQLQEDESLKYLLEGEFTPPNARDLRCLNQPLYRVPPKPVLDSLSQDSLVILER